jgi:multiple sugar transport system substrate-binding protein
MRLRLSVFVLIFILLMAACGNNNGENSQTKAGDSADVKKEVAPEPVTLKVFQLFAGITDDEFKNFIAEPVKKKYPNISFELIRSAGDVNIDSVIASGDFPDLYFIADVNLYDFHEKDVLLELSALSKKNNFNFGIFEDSVMKELKSRFDGKIYAAPFSSNFSTLYYNKDIFNELAVPIPKDGMTWEDSIALAKQITSKGSGKFIGLNAGNFSQFVSPLSNVYVNPKTLLAELNTEHWSKPLAMFKEIYTIPNNKYLDPTPANTSFAQGGLAMVAGWGGLLGQLETAEKQGAGVNFDLATYPVFKEKPKVRRAMDLHVMAVSKQSKHQDAAFQVLALMFDKDVSMLRVRQGRLSALKDKTMQTSFGADMKSLKGKNIASLFKTEAAPSSPYTKYNSSLNSVLNNGAKAMLDSGADVNTVVREMNEQANQKISAAKDK